MLEGYLALIGQGALAYRDALRKAGAEVLLLPPCPSLDARVASHPDMLLAQLGDTVFVPAAYAAAADAALRTLSARCGITVCPVAHALGRSYPADVAFNILTVRNMLYARADATAPAILAYAERAGYRIRPIRQGYAGCSSLVCGTLLISADPSVLRAAADDGLAAVSIAPQGIALPGYGCGFIGGASGCADGIAVFFGDARTHPDGERIAAVLRGRGIRILSLGEGTLTDFGGIRLFKKR